MQYIIYVEPIIDNNFSDEFSQWRIKFLDDEETDWTDDLSYKNEPDSINFGIAPSSCFFQIIANEDVIDWFVNKWLDTIKKQNPYCEVSVAERTFKKDPQC